MPLFTEARARQRRRRRTIATVMLALGIAAVVASGRGLPSPGGQPVFSAAAGSPPSTGRAGRTLTARDFVKYGIDCQTLRLAAIPIGPHMKWRCKAPSLVSLTTHKQLGPTDPLTGFPQIH